MIGSLGSFTNTEAWVDRAICSQVDPEIFWVNPGQNVRDAQRVCLRCPVRARQLGGTGECLDYALAHNEPGFWGGYSDRERTRIKKGLPAKRTHCNRGHKLDVVGTIGNGSCAECRRIWNDKYKRGVA